MHLTSTCSLEGPGVGGTVARVDGNRQIPGGRQPGLSGRTFPASGFSELGCWAGGKHQGGGWGQGARSPAPCLQCTNLLGTELLAPDGGAQQRPEGTQEPPPWPVLDRQEHSHVLLDAPRGQSTNLQGKETEDRGPVPTFWRR